MVLPRVTLTAGGVRRPVREVRALHGHGPVPHRHDALRRGRGSPGTSLAPESVVFDEFPFIFLTLMLSLQASYAAPLILLAQNRQADRDRVALEQDRARDERNLADTEFLTREVASLRLALREQATRDFVRSELRDLLGELEERAIIRRLDDTRRLAPAPPRLDPAELTHGADTAVGRASPAAYDVWHVCPRTAQPRHPAHGTVEGQRPRDPQADHRARHGQVGRGRRRRAWRSWPST